MNYVVHIQIAADHNRSAAVAHNQAAGAAPKHGATQKPIQPEPKGFCPMVIAVALKTWPFVKV